MTIDHPYDIGGSGRTATTDPDDHVRDMIEQLLLTTPGERVMRPDFGAGLLQLVFEPGGPEAAATTQYLVQSAVEQHLGQVLTADRIEVEVADSALLITVSYVVLRTRTRHVATFRTPGGRP
ncbi:GPW/gp25 family protein [Kitasatospora sp. DSM 101779]|uniref:GPW/gp25 family protein n=1 Tax=Kitasatospora sp. DSM 101779 TaxID=2853165 RepID=UPI0021DA8B13|nr:GPW/gp25 family protein [Kitasatospora sp. DSM 101779]MCU7820358.1 GPW/gp25 family protein [Kitasatospora sp. DSM 101779]